MKKLIIWLAKIFNVNLVNEKIIYKDRIVEKIVEVPVEVIKEVIKEVPVYKETKYIALKDDVTNDTFVEGNLVVKGYLYVDGEITCFKLKENGTTEQ